MSRKTASIEDPDLILRVPSSASGKITESPKDYPPKDMTLSSSSELGTENENYNNEMHSIKEPLQKYSDNYELSTEEHPDDPYALLRELHILPHNNKDASNTQVDMRDFGVYGGTGAEEIISCLESKHSQNKNNGMYRNNGHLSAENSIDNKNWHSLNGIQYMDKCGHSFDYKDEVGCTTNENEYECKYKHHNEYDNVVHHSPLCLVIIFILQFLPVFVVAILYEIHTNISLTPVTSRGTNSSSKVNSTINNG